MSIVVREITKSFGTHRALERVSLEIPHGKLTALLGPSGSGKTTLLRIIAGLEPPDHGRVILREREATDVSARERNVGFVFQHYALFKHMTVRENVGFALRMRGRPGSLIRRRVDELLDLVQLANQAGAYPHQLSGGQRQRVALARALAASPGVLLLDEPFGALDAVVRKELRSWLRRLIEEVGVTSVFVTHDQEEALEVADRIVVMNNGRIEQEGTPEDVFERPANAFVMRFLGQVNIFHGRIESGVARVGSFTAALPEAGMADAPVGYARPHQLAIERRDAGREGIVSVVRVVARAGPRARVELESVEDKRTILVELTQERAQELDLKAGERVFVIPREMKIFMEDYTI